jgi:hypothetical protein
VFGLVPGQDFGPSRDEFVDQFAKRGPFGVTAGGIGGVARVPTGGEGGPVLGRFVGGIGGASPRRGGKRGAFRGTTAGGGVGSAARMLSGKLDRAFGLTRRKSERDLAAAVADADGVELVGKTVRQQSVVETDALETGGEREFEVEPDFVGGVVEFATHPAEGSEFVVAGFDGEVRRGVGAGEGIEFFGRRAGERDGFAGEFGQGGLEIVGEDADGDLEGFGGGVVVGLGEGGVDRVGASGATEERDEAPDDEQPERRS